MKQAKKIWRKNFEITRTHLQMGTPALYDMMVYQAVTTGKKCLAESVWVQEGYNNTGTYFIVSELRHLIELTIKVILEKPGKIKKIHQRAFTLNHELFALSKKLLKMSLKKLNSQRLAQFYLKIVNLFILSHGWALPTTWFLDSDGEDFSKLLLERIAKIIKEQNSALSPVECFSILTTPAKPSLAVQEEIESLSVLNLISQNPRSRMLFSHDVRTIQNGLTDLPVKIQKKIKSHFNKWRWQAYTYTGPAYDLDYYLEVWRGLLRQRINLKKELRRLQTSARDVKVSKSKIIKALSLSTQTRKLFNTASDIVYLKSYRKDAWFFTCYAMENLYQEIGRRLGLSLNQVWFMGWWEVVPALKQGEFLADLINKRMAFSVYHQHGEKPVIYTGRRAKKFLAGLNIEKIKQSAVVKEFKGTCAYPGKARGVVKIVNQVEDMGKMQKGDIMLAHTTYPALVPAMKKAAAIVTDDGGVTCHAAIVTRELRIPGVVGTKIATKVLKDGDKVEVDATKGTVKKL